MTSFSHLTHLLIINQLLIETELNIVDYYVLLNNMVKKNDNTYTNILVVYRILGQMIVFKKNFPTRNNSLFPTYQDWFCVEMVPIFIVFLSSRGYACDNTTLKLVDSVLILKILYVYFSGIFIENISGVKWNLTFAHASEYRIIISVYINPNKIALTNLLSSTIGSMWKCSLMWLNTKETLTYLYLSNVDKPPTSNNNNNIIIYSIYIALYNALL